MGFVYMSEAGRKPGPGVELVLQMLDDMDPEELDGATKGLVVLFGKDNMPITGYAQVNWGDMMMAASTIQVDCIDKMIRVNPERYGIEGEPEEDWEG